MTQMIIMTQYYAQNPLDKFTKYTQATRSSCIIETMNLGVHQSHWKHRRL